MPAQLKEASQGPTIRPFSAADATVCRVIAARAALSSYGARMPHLAGSFSEDDPLERADIRLVAVSGDRPVGFIELVDSHVSNLFVEPAEQGRGVGSALLSAAEARVAGDLTLSVFTVNPKARRLYERHGFRVEGTGETLFRGGVEEVWRMRKTRSPAQQEQGAA